MTGTPTLQATAALVGAYRWTEDALFALTGRWAADGTGRDEVAVWLAEVSLQHAWHAELFEARLPVLAGTDPDALTVPSPGAAALVGALAGAEGDRARLGGLVRVALPRLLVAYDRHRRHAAPVADAPLVRALRLVARDEAEEWRRGEELVQSLVRGGEDAAAVTAAAGAAEAALTAAGPGLVPWPPAAAG